MKRGLFPRSLGEKFKPRMDAFPLRWLRPVVEKNFPPAVRLQKMALATRKLFYHARWVPHLTWPSTSTFQMQFLPQ